MSLTRFLGQQLVTSIGGLEPERLLGPWTGNRPDHVRRKIEFSPGAYGENDRHPHPELCLLLAGHCGFSFDHTSTLLEPGDLVVLPGQLPHAESHATNKESYQLAWWVLHENDPGLHVTRYTPRDGFVMDHLVALGTLPADARGRLQQMREMTAHDKAPDIDVLKEAMLTVTLALYRRILDGGGQQLDTRALLVRRAIDFVQAHASQPLSLSDVARAVRVSPNYLTGLFRTATGKSLGRFVLAERIALAQRLLREPGASVKAVALDLGFADPFAFSRAFKRVTGTAPRTWMANQGVSSDMAS